MRTLPIILLLLSGALTAGETSWPLWDGQETVEQYARRAKLPATETLDLGNDVKLELVLIPAGQFVMGTPEPQEPGETAVVGQAILYSGAGVALAFVLLISIRAIVKRERPKFSLRWLIALTFAAGVAVYGGVRWHKNNAAWRNYETARTRYADAYEDEKQGHVVTLTKPFYMGKFVITQQQYQQLTGENPSDNEGKDNPVENLVWNDAQKFCKKLTQQSKRNVRLPTEAEWEYACRAGSTSAYYSGETPADLDRVAWYGKNSGKTTHPVGQKAPNFFGLFDMHGNVLQFCQDWYKESYYREAPSEDPRGPDSGKGHVMRGGSYDDNDDGCRARAREEVDPGSSNGDMGFRVVVELSSTP